MLYKNRNCLYYIGLMVMLMNCCGYGVEGSANNVDYRNDVNGRKKNAFDILNNKLTVGGLSLLVGYGSKKFIDSSTGADAEISDTQSNLSGSTAASDSFSNAGDDSGASGILGSIENIKRERMSGIDCKDDTSVSVRIGEYNADIEAIKNAVGAYGDKLDGEVTDLKDEKTAADKKVKDLENKKEALDKKVEELEGETTTLESSLEEARTKADETLQTLAEVKGQNATLESSLGEARTKADETLQTLAGVKGQNATLKSSLEKFQAEAVETLRALDEVKDQNATLKSSLEKSQKDAADILNDMKKKNEERDSTFRALNTRYKVCEKKLTSAEAEVAKAKMADASRMNTYQAYMRNRVALSGVTRKALERGEELGGIRECLWANFEGINVGNVESLNCVRVQDRITTMMSNLKIADIDRGGSQESDPLGQAAVRAAMSEVVGSGRNAESACAFYLFPVIAHSLGDIDDLTVDKLAFGESLPADHKRKRNEVKKKIESAVRGIEEFCAAQRKLSESLKIVMTGAVIAKEERDILPEWGNSGMWSEDCISRALCTLESYCQGSTVGKERIAMQDVCNKYANSCKAAKQSFNECVDAMDALTANCDLSGTPIGLLDSFLKVGKESAGSNATGNRCVGGEVLSRIEKGYAK